MTYFEATILGLVQGLAEFLPISSSGHLALLQSWFKIDESKVLLFTVLLHVGTLISVYSPTKKRAAMNVLPFCLGMLLTYYATAMLTRGVYSWSFILGWTAFALLSPVMAYFAWMTKEKGVFPKVIGAGIVLASALSSVLLFDRLRVYDYVIDALLIYVIFFQKIPRLSRKGGNRA